MNNLPIWNYPGTAPAFNDTESLTALEATAKLYAAMRELITEHNTFRAAVTTEVEAFKSGETTSREEFERRIICIVDEYTQVIDEKIKKQDSVIRSLVGDIPNVTEQIVYSWLAEHPEATTTVQDGSLTEPKMHPNFLPHIKKDYVTPKMFGAKGDGTTDDTAALQNMINNAHQNNTVVVIPYGVYRTNSLILKCNMFGVNSPIILFNEGEGFTNFERDGSKRYDFTRIDGVIFESDKAAYWNPETAGAAWTDLPIIDHAKRKYGQRLFIGNNKDNIRSTEDNEIINGSGWWNRDYYQWIDAALNYEDLSLSVNPFIGSTDTNILSCPGGIQIVNCSFIGFEIGLTLAGTYDSTLYNTNFLRNKIGVKCWDASMLPGNMSDFYSKTTTLTIEKCWIEDISYVGIYGESLTESKVIDNIFQPVPVGVCLRYGAINYISKNYGEIVNSLVYIGTDDAYSNVIDNNFVNAGLSKYLAYCGYGTHNAFVNCKHNKKVYVCAGACDYDFDDTAEVIAQDLSWFYHNGNSVDRTKSKYALIKITGTGSGIDKHVIKTTRKDGTIPSIIQSGDGIEFNGKEEILSCEIVNTSSEFAYFSCYQPENYGDKVKYAKRFDTTDKAFKDVSMIEAGTTFVIKIVFNDGHRG